MKKGLGPEDLGNWAFKSLSNWEVEEALQRAASCPPRALPDHPPQPTDEEIRDELANRSLEDERRKADRRPLLDALRAAFATPHHHQP